MRGINFSYAFIRIFIDMFPLYLCIFAWVEFLARKVHEITKLRRGQMSKLEVIPDAARERRVQAVIDLSSFSPFIIILVI